MPPPPLGPQYYYQQEEEMPGYDADHMESGAGEADMEGTGPAPVSFDSAGFF